VDAGPDPHRIGGLGSGPFPPDPVIVYGSAQGLLEAPISASVDEGENLWVVTQAALTPTWSRRSAIGSGSRWLPTGASGWAA